MRRVVVLVTALLAACGGGGGGGPVDVVTAREDFNGIAAADVNRDGFTDLVAGSFSIRQDGSRSSQIVVLLQDAAIPGRFGMRREYPYSPTLVTPHEIVATDLQGDGLPDVVASSLSEAGFRVFLNDPATPGTLLPGVHYGAGVDAVGRPKLAVADMDGDARPDVVIADDSLLAYYPQSAANPGSFLAGQGFAVAPQLSTRGSIGARLAVADLDGDGQPEIVVGGTQVRIYSRTAAGDFALARSLAVPKYGTANCDGVVVADLNHDSQPDIAASMGDILEGRIFVFFAIPGQPVAFAEAVQVAPAP